MLGIGGFTPLEGFMGHDDWKGVCADMKMADGTFWPVPVTLDCDKSDADAISEGDEIALEHEGTIFATMKVTEKTEMSDDDKKWECEKVFKGEGEESADDVFWKIAEEDHPGVDTEQAEESGNIGDPREHGNQHDHY